MKGKDAFDSKGLSAPRVQRDQLRKTKDEREERARKEREIEKASN